MIIAHRGRVSVDQATENTLCDFKLAIDLKVDGIETDLRKTKCNNIIIHHDDHIQNKKIKDLNLNEIRALNQNIPTLIEFMDLINNNQQWEGIINLEIKTFDQTDIIANILNNYPKSLKRIMISSFLHFAVWEIKKKIPQVQTGLVYRCYPTSFNVFIKKPNFIILYKETLGDNPDLIRLIKKCNFYKIKMLIYTIKNKHEANFCLNFDGIIADCAQILNNNAPKNAKFKI